MGQTLTELAQQLKAANKKVQLIYAFNGIGKTRLSREFKELVAPKAPASDGDAVATQAATPHIKILYYNAFTEDLFYWDNDLQANAQRKLKIQPNSFTDWVLQDQGQDQHIITTFQRYTNDKLTPRFTAEDPENGIKAFSEVTFSMQRGDDAQAENLKISKGEESCFIWSIFYTLLEQVIVALTPPKPVAGEPNDLDDAAAPEERETSEFDNLEYVFIDDPVSSLDENHLIELAVNLAEVIKLSPESLKFIITTHNALFYNVLFNELNQKKCYLLDRLEDGTYTMPPKNGDSNTSFSYHLHLIQTIEQAIAENRVEKFHFTLLRNLYEKTACFLGYPRWADLLPHDRKLYYNRIMTFTSHSTLSNEAVAEPTQPEKAIVNFLLNHLKTNYRFWQKEEQHG